MSNEQDERETLVCGLCAQGVMHYPCTFGLELTTPPYNVTRAER